MTRAHVIALAVVALAEAACSGPPSDSRIGVLVPDRAQFPPVADVLDQRCGMLGACHGNTQRNFIVYGCKGLRLDPGDFPGCKRPNGNKDTTDAEYDATFRSLVGLEPALMSSVVGGHGKHPEVLTFVRKARGDEAHKGGAVIVPGDDSDNCIASWLGGATDTDACSKAIDPNP